MAVLIPELYVDDIDRSLSFYTALGFTTLYDRPDQRFAMIDRDGASIMLEEPTGRTFGIVNQRGQRGKGMNLQIAVADCNALWTNLSPTTSVILAIETRTYDRSADQLTVRQFVIADPDGYLLRFSQPLAVTPARPPATP